MTTPDDNRPDARHRDAFDDLIQSILDSPPDDPRRRELISAVRRDPQAMHDLHASADAIARLRSPVDAPDLSERILHAAHARRRFLPSRLRRLVDRSRIATAGALLLTLALVATLQRHWPDATRLATPDRPLSALPQALSDDAVLSAGILASGVSRALAPLGPREHDAALHPLDAQRLHTPRLHAPRLEAWILSVNGPDGSVYDTVMTYDRSAPHHESLRLYTLPPRSGPSVLTVQPTLPAPRAEPLTLP